MGLVASTKVLAAGAAWRLSGLGSAGRVLIDAVTAGAEDEQALAGVLLVRAGDRSVSLISTAIDGGSAAVELVDVLASIGSDTARTALEHVAAAPARGIAASAEQALRDLDQIRRQTD